MSRPQLRLSSSRLAANVAAVRDRIAPSDLMLVVKDDAYGHGLRWAVETAARAGVRWFGSYDIGSGLEVRRLVGPSGRIFAWATSTDAEVDDALAHDIELGVGSPDYLARVIDRARRNGRRARVHLKIDTGLHRNGLLPDEWDAAVRAARAAETAGSLDLAGIWSHIAEASDEEDDDANAAFRDAVRIVGESGPTPGALHLTASAASWWRPELRGSVSRIGAFCYGIRSADGPDLEGIAPAAELTAQVTAVRRDEVVVGIGAFDGLPSALVGAEVGTPAGARGILRIDGGETAVAPWPDAAPGDTVHIFGDGARGESSATTLAERIDTVGEEILTRLSPRVPRVIVD